MKRLSLLIPLLIILIIGCGPNEAEKGKTTGAVTPAPEVVTMDSIKPATVPTLAQLMTEMSQAYTEMGQKVEAKDYKSAQIAWENMVANTKAILNFGSDKQGPDFETNQKNFLSGLDEIGKMISSQTSGTSEKIAGLSKICDACHKEYRK